VNDVPCQCCEYCGEQYFQASTLKAIETEFYEIYSNGKKIKNNITVPVESFSELLSA
jgi:hypothetical protein